MGAEPSAILAAARAVLGDAERRARMARPALPYGDGSAAQAISAVLLRQALPSSARTSESSSRSDGHRRSSPALAR
ncbi:hypothetical protein [Sandarakinorhabdus rubra]|uniref:hypothetical protein n=1 Tax=Sandarakinorhabdus rubra TaxID=2672568 RepID=UPI0038B47AC8